MIVIIILLCLQGTRAGNTKTYYYSNLKAFQTTLNLNDYQSDTQLMLSLEVEDDSSNLNLEQLYPKEISKFIAPYLIVSNQNFSNNQVKLDTNSYQITIQDQSPDFFYQTDNQGFQTMSDYHIIHINLSDYQTVENTLFITFEDLNLLFFKKVTLKIEQTTQCFKQCFSNSIEFEGQYDKQNQDHGVCQYQTCQCQFNYFGSFCQYISQQLKYNELLYINFIKKGWQYLAVEFDLYIKDSENQLTLQVSNLTQELLISFAYKGLPNDVPNLFCNPYIISPKNLQLGEDLKSNYTQYSLEIQSQYYEGYLKNNHIKQPKLYIGFYNIQDAESKLGVKIFASKVNVKSLNQSYILVGLILVNSIIGISFLVYQSCVIINNCLISRADPKKRYKGFKQKKILKYFGGYSYDKLILIYDSFKELTECVICLEDIKFSTKNDIQVASVTNDIQVASVSVTPCFHMFHEDCLQKWLQNAKYCPICREEFTLLILKQKYPWIKLDEMSLGQSDIQYVKRMKQQNNVEISQLIIPPQSNKSQQILIRKDGKIQQQQSYEQIQQFQFDQDQQALDQDQMDLLQQQFSSYRQVLSEKNLQISEPQTEVDMQKSPTRKRYQNILRL